MCVAASDMIPPTRLGQNFSWRSRMLTKSSIKLKLWLTIGFQLPNAIVSQIVNKLRSEMVPTTNQQAILVEEIKKDTPSPPAQEIHIANTTQEVAMIVTTATMTNFLVTMQANMKAMRLQMKSNNQNFVNHNFFQT